MRLLKTIAAAGAALVLAILACSATIRLTHAGLGCTPWPACYGAQEAVAADAGLDLVRAIHRATASLAGMFALVLAVAGWNVETDRAAMRRTVMSLLLLVVFLALLGVYTTGATRPAVTLGNVLGGMAMFALFGRVLWLGAPPLQRPGSAPQPALLAMRRTAAIALGFVVVQIALGVLVTSRFAGAACGDAIGCGLSLPGAAVLDPLLPTELGAFTPTALAGLQLLHRIGALATLACLLWLALRCAPYRGAVRWAGIAAIALATAEIGVGWFSATNGLPIGVAVTHNLLAAALLLVVSNLAVAAWRR